MKKIICPNCEIATNRVDTELCICLKCGNTNGQRITLFNFKENIKKEIQHDTKQ